MNIETDTLYYEYCDARNEPDHQEVIAAALVALVERFDDLLMVLEFLRPPTEEDR